MITKRTLTIVSMLISLLLVGVNCFAGEFTIYGWVIDKITRQGITGVTISNSMMGKVITNGNGAYEIKYHNYCGDKTVRVEKEGYITKLVSIWDNSCPECDPLYDPNNPPVPPPPPCGTYKMVNIELLRFNADGDNDGILNAYDNCAEIANGPAKGTCMSGSKRGSLCYHQGQCGCAAGPMPCSLNQEDYDNDGVGNVCDSTPSGAGMAPQRLAVAGMHQELIAFWVINFCMKNSCSYGCLQQLIEDVMNGPDFMFGHPTRPDSGELADCPDVYTFIDFVNEYLDTMWEHFYGDNFQDK